MKSLINLGLMLLVCSISAIAQVEPGSFGIYNEALLFSRTSPGGSARIQGIGGAQVALGGDISLANSNPAGLGFFNSSVFSFTPSFNFHESDSQFRGTGTNTFKNNFNINNMGVVFNNTKRDIENGKLRGGSFALSFQRINNFHNEFRYEGFSGDNSIVDTFIENAGNEAPGNLSGFEAIAYDHFLIDQADYDSNVDYDISNDGVITPNPGDGTIEGYASLVGRVPGSLPRQEGSVRSKGSQYQWNVSYGANYDDLFYFGGGIGVQSISYTRERTFIEDAFAFEDGNGGFVDDDLINEIRIDDRLRINGIGINATLGIIVRPVDFFRFGASYVTPTFSSLNEESDYFFTTNWNSFYSYNVGSETIELGEISDQSDLTISNYRLRSPSKLSLGTAFFIGKGGFLTADVEFVDYSNAQFKSNDFSVTADNRSINNLYKSTTNFRVGGEMRFDIFRFRAGYSYQGDPFTDSAINNSISNISGGIGYRVRDYYVDLAVTNTKSDALFTPYNLGDGSEPVAGVKNNSTNVAVTLGFKF
ncbi:MAG: hypothetical protein RIG77_16070 [Cyclobacteriaceae bacterium]